MSRLHKTVKQMFIVIEGAEHVGKTTVIDELVKYFYKAHLTVARIKFPVKDTITGKEIYALLDKSESPPAIVMQSLQIVNRMETLSLLKTHIANCDMTIADRYWPSTLVYGLIDNLPKEFSLKMAEFLPKPDLIFVLHGHFYNLHQDSKGCYDVFNDKIHLLYRHFADEYGWKLISNDGSPKDICRRIISEL